MNRLTEKDLEYENNNNENIKEDNIEKIILNKVNVQTANNNEDSSSSVKESSDSSDISSSICNAVSSVKSLSEVVIDSSSLMVSKLEVVEAGIDTSVSQDTLSCKPKQDANLDAVTGVSVAVVAMAEKILDLQDSQMVLYQVKSRLNLENISLKQENIILILKITMECIEKSSLKGLSQKELAIQILNKLLNESGMDNESQQILNNYINTNLISDTIDLLVGATKGELDINKSIKIKTKRFEKIYNCFSRCLNKNKNRQEETINNKL